ncbi:NPCBM/NEW2 domain-containing protein [Micromonospora wenchangensis]|uniref:NPCBM/NEW2 domain-containing protein n=1 Tax=Micromonospora wenchangensis TaxID=1185415 RepID=UPI00381A0154
MSRYFGWVKDHQKLALAGVIIGAASLLVATLGFGRDLFGIEFSQSSNPVPTSAAGPSASAYLPPSASEDPTSDLSQSPSDEASPTPTETVDPTPTPQDSPEEVSVRYLDELDAEDRNGGYVRGLVTMGNKPFDRSVELSCNGTNTYFVFPVAGMRTLDFWLGIDDNTSGASGLVADVAFYRDSGGQLDSNKVAKLGPATHVKVDLTGTTQLKIRCTGRNANSGRQANVAHVAFGKAVLTASPR